MEQIKTNADLIRVMSNEELKDLLMRSCPSGVTREVCNAFSSCDNCWLWWLQRPAEEDDHEAG